MSAIERTTELIKDKDCFFISLGNINISNRISNGSVLEVPFINNSTGVAEYYQAADILLHAANAESFPNVIIEALSCGLPVIATNVGGIPEQVTDGYNGFLVQRGNHEEMAQKISYLLHNDAQRMQMGSNAYASMKDVFSKEKMAMNYMNFYEEVIKMHKSIMFN